MYLWLHPPLSLFWDLKIWRRTVHNCTSLLFLLNINEKLEEQSHFAWWGFDCRLTWAKMHVCVLCTQGKYAYAVCIHLKHPVISMWLWSLYYMNYYNHFLWNPGNINQTDIGLKCMTGIFWFDTDLWCDLWLVFTLTSLSAVVLLKIAFFAPSRCNFRSILFNIKVMHTFMYWFPNKGKNVGHFQSSDHSINAAHFWVYHQQCAFPPQFTPLSVSDNIPIFRPSCRVSKLVCKTAQWGPSKLCNINQWFLATKGFHNLILTLPLI